MRITQAQIKADADASSAVDISARAYWQDVALYPPAQRKQRIEDLEHAAQKLPTGGAAHMLRSLERQGYI
jgi:hypothetical protein